MTNQEIKELLQIFDESGVAEMEVQRGENRLRLRRVPMVHEMTAHSAPPAAHTHAPAPAPAPAAAAPKGSGPDPSHTLIKSPIVGTYYDAPSPEAGPFVKVGDTVEPGQVLCIIESMKLMNEIEAEIAGTLVHKLVALFAIRPR
jgi:acetyl-CoA carboxylase biotin carboxyl carrier protein